MAKNLINGTNIIIEENGDNINLDLSSTYTDTLNSRLNLIENSLNTHKTYSTAESVIGSYNGKVLYRRVFTGTATGSTNTLTNSYTSDDIQIINGGGTIYQTGTNRQMKAGGYINANWNSGFYVNESGIQLMVSSELSGGDYSVYVEYTKTTD